MKYTTKSLMIIIAIASIVMSGCDQSQRTFKSPELAVTALKDAVKKQDKKELHQIFGSRTDELKSGDADQDQEDFRIFARRLEARHAFEKTTADRRTLLIGNEAWPFAVPLVKIGDVWVFDTDAGIEELINRRVGRNELRTIEACRTVIDAQAEFFERDPDDLGIKHYAQRLMSTEGARDGLYWRVTGNEDPSPIGPVLAQAATRTNESGERIPYNGYLFKLLTRQSAGAPGGEKDYDKDGKLTKGWAAIAYPAEYGETGVMTFMFGHGGVMYEKDLGSGTASLAKAITAFDPSKGWKKVK